MPEVAPSVPFARAAPVQVKLPRVLASVTEFPVVPGVEAVSVTVPAPEAAVTPSVALLSPIAVARAVASSAFTLSIAKLVAEVVPFAPPVRFPPFQAKNPVVGVTASALAAEPHVVAEIVTLEPLEVAVTPTVAWARSQAFIAAVRFVARAVVVAAVT